jgi:hypothetical protein
MKVIKLTDAQHAMLKVALDEAIDPGAHTWSGKLERLRADKPALRELWHACARATTEPDPA